jgi:hypothetical protein
VNDPDIILNGPDPGPNGDESEADIDVQWSGAVAKNAKIDFVVSESTETTDGVDLSALYIIDNNLAPILSESFGQCEQFLGTASNSFFASLWQQAAAQGISVFLSTGDSGAAGCDNNIGIVPQPALGGLAVSGLASTPFNVAVGGTDFNDAANPLTFWNPTNDPTTQVSAKGYIPETTWNNSCTNGIFVTVGFSTNAETNCNNSQLTNFVLTVGAGGGVSTVYSKPSWQTGAGVPSDGKRDLPDVSLFASNGFVGNFYVICEADINNIPCSLNNLAGFGGTSVSTPAFAGIMALAEQAMATSTGNANFRQGNPNYVLYKLAATHASAFHDVPAGSTIAMPCQNTPDCTKNVSADIYGILSGYATTTGYDRATGLGSVDANALVTNWSSVSFSASATTMSAPSPTSITHGQAVTATVTVAAVPPATGTPTGDVSLLASTGQSLGRFTLSGGTVTATTNTIPGGTQTLIAHYEGDGIFGGSDSAASSVITVAPEASKTALAFETFNSTTGSQTNANATTAVYGGVSLLRTNVTNSVGTSCAPVPLGQFACPSGTIALTDSGSPLDGGSFALNTLGYTEDQVIQLTGGSHNIQAQYSGDTSFNTSTANETITITPEPTTMSGISVAGNLLVNAPIPVSATVSAESFGVAPGGTFTFSVDGVPSTSTITYAPLKPCIGSDPQSVCLEANTNIKVSTGGNHIIGASYSGESNYAGSTAQPKTLSFTNSTTMALSISTLTPAPSQSVTLTAVVDTEVKNLTPTGTVTFENVTGPSPTGTVTYTPITDTNGNSALQASITFIPPRNRMVVLAEYSGDPNYQSSDSTSSTILVTGNDFNIIPTTSNATTIPGEPATQQLIIDGQSAYSGTINFTPSSCAGLPAESSCIFTPAAVVGDNVTTLQIATALPHAILKKESRNNGVEFINGSLALVFGVLLMGISPKKRSYKTLLSLIVLACCFSIVSCGGGSVVNTGGGSGGGSGGGGGGGGGPTDPGTPVGTYTVTVTATSNTNLTHTVSFQLTVQ